MALEHVSEISHQNICARQSTYYQTILRFPIGQTEMFSNSMCLYLMKIYDKSAAMVISVVFNTREYVDSRIVF